MLYNLLIFVQFSSVQPLSHVRLFVLGRWDFPGQRIEPMSPALAGRFFTNDPPGKPTVYQIKPNLSGFKQQTWGLSFCRSGIWVQFTQTLRLSQTSGQTSHNAATQGQVLHLPNLIPLNSGQSTSKVHPESTQCCHPVPQGTITTPCIITMIFKLALHPLQPILYMATRENLEYSHQITSIPSTKVIQRLCTAL